MWLASGRVQALGTALHDGRRDEVERLLEDVLDRRADGIGVHDHEFIHQLA